MSTSYDLPCGNCRIEGGIVFCPLHAVAPELLAAARDTINHLMSKARRDPAEQRVVRILRETIARAEGHP